MISNSFITRKGELRYGNENIPVTAPIILSRKGKILFLLIRKHATVSSLLGLIGNIRAYNGFIEVCYTQNGKETQIPPAPADVVSLTIGRLILLKIESKRQRLSQSHIYSSSDAIRHDSSLPDIFHQLISMHSPSDLTSNALLKLQNLDLSIAAFYFRDQTNKFCLGKTPKTYFWPDKSLFYNDTVDATNFGTNASAIITILETAMACRSPILQKGIMKTDHTEESTYFPFARIAIPMSSIAEQPFNYRVLTIAIRQTDNAVMI